MESNAPARQHSSVDLCMGMRLAVLLVCVSGQALFALTFNAGQFTLAQGQSQSFGSFALTMQADGNLVLYQGSTALWSTGTYGQNCGTNSCKATFQSDGNFVVYNGSTALWNSQTEANANAVLVLSTALPHIEIVASQSILWANAYLFSAGNLQLPQGATVNIGSEDFKMQSDGNFVLYSGSTALWSSGSFGHNCGNNQCDATFQTDGNFVIYDGSSAIWNSGTSGNSGAILLLSGSSPYFEVLGTMVPAYPAKEYIRLNGTVIAIENP